MDKKKVFEEKHFESGVTVKGLLFVVSEIINEYPEVTPSDMILDSYEDTIILGYSRWETDEEFEKRQKQQPVQVQIKHDLVYFAKYKAMSEEEMKKLYNEVWVKKPFKPEL